MTPESASEAAVSRLALAATNLVVCAARRRGMTTSTRTRDTDPSNFDDLRAELELAIEAWRHASMLEDARALRGRR